ncbi:MAG: hypothetical protein JJU00_14760 [Opitutales bacterium]|nr:hypothetical protein [Opitutales bacterium]
MRVGLGGVVPYSYQLLQLLRKLPLCVLVCLPIAANAEEAAPVSREQIIDWARSGEFHRIEEVLDLTTVQRESSRTARVARTVRYLKRSGARDEETGTMLEEAAEQLETHVRARVPAPGAGASSESEFRYHFRMGMLEQVMDNRMAALEHFLEAEKRGTNPALRLKIAQLRHELKADLESMRQENGGGK